MTADDFMFISHNQLGINYEDDLHTLILMMETFGHCCTLVEKIAPHTDRPDTLQEVPMHL